MDINAEKPKITHLLPVKNGEKFLAQILPSIALNATPEDQILIINDGSSDDSLDLIQEFAGNNQNVEIISTLGIGLVSALNLGIANSRNDWIARYDVDDRYEKNRVSRQIEVITSKTVAIFADYDFWIDDKKFAGFIPSPIFENATKLSLLKSQQTPHPSVLLNRGAVLEAGSYIKAEYPAEDLGLWIRLTKVGSLISVPETLLHYRLSKASITGTLRSQSMQSKNHLISKYSSDFLIYSKDKQIEEDWYNYDNFSNRLQRKLFMYRNLVTAKHKTGMIFPKKLEKKFLLELVQELSMSEIYNMTKYKGIRQFHRLG